MRLSQKQAKYILVALMLAILFIAVLPVIRTPNLPKASKGYKWHQVLGDEFNTRALDVRKWVTCYDWYDKLYNGCTNSGNQELEWYMPRQVRVANGSVTLSAAARLPAGWPGAHQQDYPYHSGMISTGRPDENSNPKSSYTYGYFEARMKTVSGKGLWPAFWLLPANRQWPPEIDVMEITGDKPKTVLMTYHWGASPAAHQEDSTVFSKLSDPNGWHTYAVNWQPGRIDWYIDGQERKSVISTNVPNTPMEVIADLAVGGSLPGNPNPYTRFPATMQIDYIRVYQQLKP